MVFFYDLELNIVIMFSIKLVKFLVFWEVKDGILVV